MRCQRSCAILWTAHRTRKLKKYSNNVGQPRLRRQVTLFEGTNLVGLAQGQADVVQTVQQAILAKSIDLERIHQRAIAGTDDLAFQIDHETIAWEGAHFIEQVLDLRFGQDDGQQAVLEAVVEKDVGEAWRDHGTEAVLIERPRRMFARRAAAEVLARQENAGSLVTRLVQDEIRVQRTLAIVAARFALVEITPFIEQVRAEAGTQDGLEELLGDDGVGIDVGAVERRDDAFVYGELFHGT